MNYVEIMRDCDRRMKIASAMTGVNIELSQTIWMEAFNRKRAALEALFQQRKINYTNCGSADLRLEICRN